MFREVRAPRIFKFLRILSERERILSMSVWAYNKKLYFGINNTLV